MILNLGEVAATAKVLINGRQADIRIIPPHRVNISKVVRPGENLIEGQVANTLANHFSVDIRSHYVMKGQRQSGLIGPVSIEVLSRVELTSE